MIYSEEKNPFCARSARGTPILRRTAAQRAPAEANGWRSEIDRLARLGKPARATLGGTTRRGPAAATGRRDDWAGTRGLVTHAAATRRPVASSFLVRDACPHHSGLRPVQPRSGRPGEQWLADDATRQLARRAGCVSDGQPRPAAERLHDGHFPGQWRVFPAGVCSDSQPVLPTRQSANKCLLRRSYYRAMAGPITDSHSSRVIDSG
jgi:hypothetical protein